MATIIDSLLVSLGFKVEPEGLEKFAKHVEGVKHMAEAVFSFEIVKRIGEFVEGSIEAAAHIQDTAEAFDLSATKMAALGKVAVAHSSDLAAVSAAYQGISQMAGQAAMGIGRGAKLFQQLGLHAKDGTGKAKSGLEVMGDVADKLAKAGTTGRLAMASRLGIDPVLAKAMAQMGRQKFMEEVASAEGKGILSEHDYEVADQTEIAFKQLHGTVKNFTALVAIQLGPTVQKLNKEFGAWVAANRQVIVQKTREFFEKVRWVLSKVVDGVKELAKHGTALKAIVGLLIAQSLGSKVKLWVGPLIDLAASMKNGAAAAEALKKGVTNVKTALTGGIVAAIGLVIEDLWQFYHGGESATGWLLERFPYAVEVAQGAIAVLSGTLVALTVGSGPLGLLVVGIGGFVIAAQSIRDAWTPLMQWFGEAWDGVLDDVKRFVNYVTGPLRSVAEYFGVDIPKFDVQDNAGAMPSGDTTGGRLAFEARQQRFNARTNKGFGPMLEGAGNMLTWGPGLAAAGAGAGGGNTTTITQTNGPTTIQVNGAQDPAKVADEVIRKQEQRRQLARQATRDAQPGHR
jgi:hypothetical protein